MKEDGGKEGGCVGVVAGQGGGLAEEEEEEEEEKVEEGGRELNQGRGKG